jgi:hypothetical protein
MSIGDSRRVTDRAVPILDPPPRGLGYHARRALFIVGLAIATYVLFPASPAVDVPIFEVGGVANQDVIAPFAFTVRKSEAELAKEREELARSAKPIFTYSATTRDSVLRTLDEFMTAVGRAAASAGSPREAVPAVQRAASDFNVTLLPGEAEYLAVSSRRATMREGIRRVYARWLSAGVTSSSALDDVRGEVILRQGSEERNMLSDSLLTFSALLSRARLVHPAPDSSVGDALYIKLLSAFFRPTVTYDRIATERRRQELRNSVDTTQYTVRAGERIIGEHEVVGREEHDKLRALHDAMQSRTGGERSAGRVTGTVLYNALVLLILWVTIGLFRPALYDSMRWLATFAVLSLLVLAGAAVVAHITPVRPELVPIALAAIIFSILFDPRISMIAAMILAVLIGGQAVFRGTNALFINLIVGATAAISVRIIRRRDQAYYSILAIAGAYLLAALAIGLTLDWSPRVIGMSALWGSVNAVVAVSLAMVLLPLAEKLTFITTDLTLLEYSDLNRKLLRRLMLEAPGTYAHTMRVANLVEAACNAVGANGLLGRVGTYYHDIGKLKKPQYFVENQAKGANPHDKLKPTMSATIIRNHVREGLEMAGEHKLPRAISAFIPEHHGTGPIAYFLEKARERGEVPPNPGDFQYPGPIPQSAETAILMLADSVEAATNVLSDANANSIREVVDRIVKQRIDQGQLRDAPLTLRQLDLIKEQFVRVLVGMHHNRIDYPTASGGITSEFAAV